MWRDHSLCGLIKAVMHACRESTSLQQMQPLLRRPLGMQQGGNPQERNCFQEWHRGSPIGMCTEVQGEHQPLQAAVKTYLQLVISIQPAGSHDLRESRRQHLVLFIGEWHESCASNNSEV